MAALQNDFAALLTEYGVPEMFTTFLRTSELLSISDYVWAANNKAEKVDEELIAASGLTGLSIKQRVTIRQSWHAASIIFAKKVDQQMAPIVTDAPISEMDSRNLHEEFYRRHGFTLGARRLLNENLQGKLFREYNSAPKAFKLILPEELLLHDAIGHVIGATVTFPNGKPPVHQEEIVDNVGDTVELWMRLRALLNTLAYISVQRTGWFSFGDA